VAQRNRVALSVDARRRISRTSSSGRNLPSIYRRSVLPRSLCLPGGIIDLLGPAIFIRLIDLFCESSCFRFRFLFGNKSPVRIGLPTYSTRALHFPARSAPSPTSYKVIAST
jgi:hypothetical protein